MSPDHWSKLTWDTSSAGGYDLFDPIGYLDRKHDRAHSSGMWFCGRCKPKVEETLKVKKEIEKRCEEHFQKYCKRLESIEKKLEKKVEIQDVVALINEKSEKDKAKHEKDKIVTEQLKEKQIIDLVKQVETKSVDIVKKHLQESSISEQNVNKLVDEKIEEIDKQITDRQSRERNVIIFRMDEPNTNLIKERQAKDLETLKEMIEQIVCGIGRRNKD